MDPTGQTIVVQGTQVPRLGLGTYALPERDVAAHVRDALEVGYRHIDTARGYENEPAVGDGMVASGVPRRDIFLTTKVFPGQFERVELRAAVEDSLRSLQTDYIDLLLLHWPDPAVPHERPLATLADLAAEGRIRALGVSNWPPGMLADALDCAPVLCNQVEYHPFLDQDRLLALARERDVLIAAYRPLADGRVASDQTLIEIGAEHGKTAAQVALRWLIEQPQVAAVPKASSHARRVENLDIFDFELSDPERERIARLRKDLRTNSNPRNPDLEPDWDA
jgi:2,5-diketo-D-gluconate reductase B